MVGGAADADLAIRGIVARNVCCWGAIRVVALHRWHGEGGQRQLQTPPVVVDMQK